MVRATFARGRDARSVALARAVSLGTVAVALALAGCADDAKLCEVTDASVPISPGIYGVDALPTGRCEDGDSCEMSAAIRCDAGSYAGYSQYQCRCTGGRWVCSKKLAGASKCVDTRG